MASKLTFSVQKYPGLLPGAAVSRPVWLAAGEHLEITRDQRHWAALDSALDFRSRSCLSCFEPTVAISHELLR